MDSIYQAHLSTAKNNYIAAQAYYTRLRTSFLQDMMYDYADSISQDTIDTLAEELPSMVSEEIESISSEHIRQLIDKVQEVIRQTLQSHKRENLEYAKILRRALEAAIKNERTTSTDLGNRLHLFQDRFETIIAEEAKKTTAREAYNTIISALQQAGLVSQGTKLNSAEYGFIKRNLLKYFGVGKNATIRSFYSQVRQRMFSEHSLIGYAKNLGGAYAEQMEVDIFNKLIRQLNGVQNMFSTTAGLGDSINIHYDLISQKIPKEKTHYFKNLQNFLDEANNISVAAKNSINLGEVAYGIQSKQGWQSSIFKMLKQDYITPPATFFSIGDRKQLANSLGFNINYYSYWRGWHSSVLRLSALNNFFQAVGQFQLGYFVQGQFILMADLISTMHKNNLYLSLYYSKVLSKDKTYKKREYPTTGEVAWQAPEYNYKELSRARILQQSLNKQNKSKTKKRSKKK